MTRRMAPAMLLLGLLAASTLAAAEVLRDPMRPPDALRQLPPDRDAGPGASDEAAWRLSWTLVAEGRRVARLNEQLVHTGDEINGARVVAIGAGRVTLEVDGAPLEVRRTPARGLRTTPTGKDDNS